MTTLIDSDVRRIGMRQRNSLLPRPMSARGFLLTVLLLVLALFAGTVALPHNPYIRYQMLRNTLHERAQWIYERTHFDPTPIDIIVVGPSRSASAIDAPLLSQLLSDRLGRPIHTVNFSFSQRGEDLNYAIVKETLKSKHPAVILDAVIEQQERGGHPAFRDLADTRDILQAPLLFNKNYASNLARLPYRQLELAWYSLFPQAGGFNPDFDPARYAGTDLDRKHFPWREQDEQTGATTEMNKQLPAVYLQKNIEVASQMYTAGIRRRILPSFLEYKEFAVARTSYEGIATLAAQHGAKLALLYQPYYRGPAQPFDSTYYEKIGPILNPASFISRDAKNYEDVAHYSDEGARRMTEWLATELQPMLSTSR
jgi:hypothetical protein